jgi:two-component system phosphate regulon sensor histidine kinase PhoR
MPPRPLMPPSRRLLGALALAALPGAAALLGLVAFARLSPFAVLAALAVMLAGLAWLLLGHLRHLTALGAYARAIAAGEPASPPPSEPFALDPTLAPALTGALGALREREQSLAAHAALAERILAQLPDPLLLVDSEMRVRLANPAAEALYGGPLQGRDMVGVLRQPELLEAIDRILLGDPAETVEFTMPVPVERHFAAQVLPLPASAGEMAMTLLLLQDMTKVVRADRLRADFVANASHELRTPLSTLVGFIETLRGAARDDSQARARFLSIMQEQAGRMSRLVADLLSLSRIELNEHSVPTGAARLDEVLASVADSLAMKAEARSMRIELPAGMAALPAVQGDSDELVQLFQNLIDNAIKYGKAGTPVSIEARSCAPAAAMTPARPAVAVSVIDQGEGIAKEHLPRLTERFYRVDTARSRDLGGTGLGLAIVKHIVSRHRGALEIDSELGKGSRFTVYLPALERVSANARTAA